MILAVWRLPTAGFLTAICVLVGWPAAAGAQLINGSFDDNGGSLDGWSTFNNVIPNVIAAPITPFDGTHVAKVFGGFNGNPNYSGLLQNLPASAGQIWRAAAHVRHNSFDSMGGTPNRLIMALEFYRVPGGEFGTQDMLQHVPLTVLDGNDAEDIWMARSFQVAAPDDTVEARIVFAFEHNDLAGGAALVDGVTFEVSSACEVVWEDDFEGPGLDPARWEIMLGDGTAYGLPPGWGNNELQYYTGRPENVFVDDGLLHIIAREEHYQGRDFTSARIRTRYLGDFAYGRLEASIKLPPMGPGIWPAFWMMPTENVYGGWAASGEIDIVEAINVPTSIYATIHYGGSWPNNTQNGREFSDGRDFSADFHTYTIWWEHDWIHWFVDGRLFHIASSQTWFSDNAPENPRAPFDQLFHTLLNLAVGGDWPGPPDETTVFPQEMLVDWVRVTAGPPFDCGPPCPADLDGSGAVDLADLMAVLSAWGNPGTPEDLDDSGIVDFNDLLLVLSQWGDCP